MSDEVITAINAIKIGSEVTITRPKIQGLVNCVAIYQDGHISYEIVYWKDSERKSIWVGENELETYSMRKLPVGFISS